MGVTARRQGGGDSYIQAVDSWLLPGPILQICQHLGFSLSSLPGGQPLWAHEAPQWAPPQDLWLPGLWIQNLIFLLDSGAHPLSQEEPDSNFQIQKSLTMCIILAGRKY